MRAGAALAALCALLAAGAAGPAHQHGAEAPGGERAEDGAWRARDASHYVDQHHNTEFDHEAILGSVKEAEEFDKLSAEESQQRLGQLVHKMDLNGDKYVDRDELKKWILNSFVKLSREEAEDRMEDTDSDKDGFVTWTEYLRDTFGVDDEDEVGAMDTGESGMLLFEEKEMWAAADANSDNKLDITEFEVFTNPEEHPEMHPYIIKQTLREKDKNTDGRIDFQEFVGESGREHDKEWIISEKEKFDHELDLNSNGSLDENEIKQWVIPDNNEIAEEEVDHLFAAADDDHDDMLSYEEITDHHDVFVGSEATDYGGDLLGEHFGDEL